jgi:putative ABC transport system permease protein
MGKAVLVGRLAARDLRHHPVQALLMLLVITAAAATLTLGLALHGATSHPYQQTRAATHGPDLVAQISGPAPGRSGPPHPGVPPQVLAQVRALIHASGAIGHSGPYPVASTFLRVHGTTAPVEVEGRDQAPASIEQPKLTAGHWVRPGGVVIERTYAAALGVGVGDQVMLNGWPFTVAGIAVTAAAPPYPNLCIWPGGGTCGVFDLPARQPVANYGLVWATQPDARVLASPTAPLWYFLNLRLRDPARAGALAATLVPAVRAARTSTVSALADEARPPRRRAVLIAVSRRLPVPLLLGLRLLGRRPRRALLSAASIAVTVSGVVAVLAFHATGDQRRFGASSGLVNPVASREEQLLLVLTVVLLALAAINATVTAWAAVLDTRHTSALVRALGASPQQVSAGVSAAQALPALPGAIVGIPAGIGLFAVANGAGVVTVPPVPWLLAAVLGTLLALAGLTAIPATLGTRPPPGEILQSETG